MRNVLKPHISCLCFLSAIFIFSACSHFITQPERKEKVNLYPIPVSEYPEFLDDMAFDSLDHAISQSISYLTRLPASTEFDFGNQTVNTTHMIQSLETFMEFIQSKPDHNEMKTFIQQNYDIYRSVGSKEDHQVLFTGYYEPILHGSLRPSDQYRFPI